jgi:hypothetical protein
MERVRTVLRKRDQLIALTKPANFPAYEASSRLTPAAMRPIERSESALRAALNAVSAATVTPGASPGRSALP